MLEMYKKNDNGNYELVGQEFSGWPSNGIWIVEDGKNNCIYKFDNVSEKPTPSLVSYMQYADELQEVISNEWSSKSLSVHDIARISCKFFALKAGGMKVGEDIIEN